MEWWIYRLWNLAAPVTLTRKVLKAYSAEPGQLILLEKSEGIYSFIRAAYHGRLSFLVLTCFSFDRPLKIRHEDFCLYTLYITL